MKRTVLIIIALVFALTGCANVWVDDKPTVSTDTPQPSTAEPDSGVTENISSFSYEEINYKANDPGVKCDGFYNTSEVEVSTRQQAIDRAKNECTVEYDTIDVFYDNVSNAYTGLNLPHAREKPATSPENFRHLAGEGCQYKRETTYCEEHTKNV